jgi:hypothetical protein
LTINGTICNNFVAGQTTTVANMPEINHVQLYNINCSALFAEIVQSWTIPKLKTVTVVQSILYSADVEIIRSLFKAKLIVVSVYNITCIPATLNGFINNVDICS